MRTDGDLIVDAGETLATARTLDNVWRADTLDRLAPDTIEAAARLLRIGAHRANATAHRLERHAAHRRQVNPR